MGESTTITATATPAGVAVSWAVADEEVASVEDGVVTALGVGTTTITASVSYSGRTASATYSLEVTEE